MSATKQRGQGGDSSTANYNDKMRNKRKDNYQIKNDPFLASIGQSDDPNSSIPQFINIHQFVSSRSHELKHFTGVLKNKLNSKMEH